MVIKWIGRKNLILYRRKNVNINGGKGKLENYIDLPKWPTTKCVLTNDNMVHFLYPKEKYHEMIPLDQLILRKLCQKYDGTLVYAYIQKIERGFDIDNTPQEIVRLISLYFSCVSR